MEPLNSNTKPANCLLLIAFSLTETEFIKDLSPESIKEYARLTASNYKLLPHFLWLHHHLPLVNAIKNTAAAVERLGVTVQLNTTLKNLQPLAGFDIVTIVAHFNNEKCQIELSDRLHSIDEFVAHTDNNFRGIFDLSVCNSTLLQDRLKEKFGDTCFVKANRDLAEIKIHLVLYKNVIEMLNKFDTNYLTAMMKLKGELNTYIKNHLQHA